MFSLFCRQSGGFKIGFLSYFCNLALQLVQEVCVQRHWGQRGSPWEFNLRDMFRWCQLMQNDQTPGLYNPGQHVGLVYADRMRSEADKAQVRCSTLPLDLQHQEFSSLTKACQFMALKCIPFDRFYVILYDLSKFDLLCRSGAGGVQGGVWWGLRSLLWLPALPHHSSQFAGLSFLTPSVVQPALLVAHGFLLGRMQVGLSVLPRTGGSPLALDPPLSITHKALRPLESLMKCVEMGWMAVLVGPTGSGKTSLVRLLALLTGRHLRVMAMNSSMDTTELLGGFEQVPTNPSSLSFWTKGRKKSHPFLSHHLQVDIMRLWQQVLETVEQGVAMVTRRGLMSLEVGMRDTEFLLHRWGLFCQWQKHKGLQRIGGTVGSEDLNKLEVIIVLLQKLNSKLKVFAGNQLKMET